MLFIDGADRVFGWDSPTRQVYEEAAKKIALSVLSGMNCEFTIYILSLILSHDDDKSLIFDGYSSAATIFAYGQTSSGKTYTMTGITEYSVTDIYDYIDKVGVS